MNDKFHDKDNNIICPKCKEIKTEQRELWALSDQGRCFSCIMHEISMSTSWDNEPTKYQWNESIND